MARTISDEELQLKRRARRRLIGAIVLVTVIVVVLPMVLDSEPKPVSRDINVQIPSPTTGAFAPMVAPPRDSGMAPRSQESKPPSVANRDQGKSAADAATASPVRDAPQQTATSASPSQATKPAKTVKSKTDPVKARTPSKTSKPAAEPADKRYVVQVIALADADKAKQMQQRIAAAGITSYTEIVKTVKGDVTRVRAGPFATREAAEKAREQLKSIGMSGNISSR